MTMIIQTDPTQTMYPTRDGSTVSKAGVSDAPVCINLAHASVNRASNHCLSTLTPSPRDCLLIPIEPMAIAVIQSDGLIEEHHIRAYSVSWVAAGKRLQAADTGGGELLLVQIDPDWLSSMYRLANASFDCSNIPMIDRVHTDIPLIGAAIVRLLASSDEGAKDMFLRPMLDWLLSRCICELDSTQPENSQIVLSDGELRTTLQEIEQRLPEPVPVADLAATLGMSNSRYSRAFKASLGCPPSRYVLQRRVSNACRLLETTAMTLIDVTFESGFSSQSHMTFVFVKELGVTPGQYRKSCGLQGNDM